MKLLDILVATLAGAASFALGRMLHASGWNVVVALFVAFSAGLLSNAFRMTRGPEI